MPDFPIDLLKPTIGNISGSASNASMTIPLSPFTLDGETVDTQIVLGTIVLPTLAPDVLDGHEYTFPPNPKDGYIDGSVYIDNAHHPVDVSSMHFRKISKNMLEVDIKMKLVFSYAGLKYYSDAETTLITPIQIQQNHM